MDLPPHIWFNSQVFSAKVKLYLGLLSGHMIICRLVYYQTVVFVAEIYLGANLTGSQHEKQLLCELG